MTSQIITLFLAGMITILLPCILPLVPIVLGVSLTGKHPLRPFFTILGMVLSFVGFVFLLQVVLSQFVEVADYLRLGTYYVLLLFGFGFAFHRKIYLQTGAVLGSLFFVQKGWPAVVGALIFGLIAVEIGGRVASYLQSFGTSLQTKTRQNLGNDSLTGAFLIGLTMGLVWVPCAGPALGFVLTLVRDEPGVYALTLLLAYGLGTAVPLLLVGYGGQRIAHSFKSLGRFTDYIKRGSGVILIITALALRFDWFMSLQTALVLKYDIGRFGNELERRLFEEDEEPLSGSGALEFPAAPELQSEGPWYNSEPLTMESLRGKVVLVDFWTYSCINCIRTLPYLRQYWDKYQDAPFVLLGVHSPEFVFEKSEANVRAAIERYNLTYPIVQDNNFGTWRAFDNSYWPAKYLIDAEGNIRYTHFGEGDYEETDAAIAALLREIGVEVGSGGIVSEEADGSQRMRTPETYLGSRSWAALANKQGSPTADVFTYVEPANVPLHSYALVGDWQMLEEERQVLRSNEGEIILHFTGSEANLVLGLEEGVSPVAVEVIIDGEAADSFTVDRDDLFELYKGEYGEHTLRLKFSSPGVAGYAFTFGA